MPLIDFTSVEVVGGVLANSLAIKTDAAHLLTDFVAFMVSLLSVHMASRHRHHSQRFETVKQYKY